MNKLALVMIVSMLWTGTLLAQASGPAATAPAAKTQPASTTATTASVPTTEAADELELPAAYKNLATELGMSERQQGELLASLKRYVDAAQVWEEKNGPTVKSLQNAMVEAYREGDKDTVKKIQEQLAKLSKERREISQRQEKEFMAILSPSQRQQYAALQVASNAMQPYAHLELTDRQQDVIKGMAARAQAEIAKAGDDKAKIDAIYDALYKDIETNVLNDEQKKTLKSPTTRPGRKTSTEVKHAITNGTPKTK